jgi:hypothetical protein
MNMAQALQNADMNLRRAARHRTDHKLFAESRRHGDQYIHIVNISAHVLMIDNNPGYERGERVELKLPIIGRIEALVIWTVAQRAGLQFERVLRFPDFLVLLDEIGHTSC